MSVYPFMDHSTSLVVFEDIFMSNLTCSDSSSLRLEIIVFQQDEGCSSFFHQTSDTGGYPIFIVHRSRQPHQNTQTLLYPPGNYFSFLLI